MSKLIEDSTLQVGASITDALSQLELTRAKIVLILDPSGKLAGTVTDGDIRRAILRGTPLSAPIDAAMNNKPRFIDDGTPLETARRIMEQEKFYQMPVLDAGGHLMDLLLLEDMGTVQTRREWVVLMAGGEGQRLRPLTETAPKPLLSVGDRPILRTVIERFVESGFRQFYITVHYRAADIVEYFGDGSEFGVEIRYIRESKPQGTAGSLSKIADEVDGPVLVMNGDILTKVNFSRMLEFHLECKAMATMAVREYEFRVPFGVVELDHHQIRSITEKPTRQFYVNAGIYVLDPEAIKQIPTDDKFDMPTLFRDLQASSHTTVAYPVSEYWIDVGRFDDLEQARGEFGDVFLKSDS